MAHATRSDDCVLVVDDEEGIRESLRELVEMAGCSALLASNGIEALKLLDERRPCLIIIDLLMPGMGGGELIEAMQQHPELRSLPILISTSAPDRAPSGYPVMPKPIDILKVWDRMRETCRCAEAAPR